MTQRHNDSQGPITEATLAAYVDGELSHERCLEVEAHLARRPEDARCVDAYMWQNRKLHEAFDHVLAEPMPRNIEHLEARLRDRLAGRRESTPRARILVSLVAAGVVLGSGWIGYQALQQQPPAAGLFALLDKDITDESTGTAEPGAVQQAAVAAADDNVEDGASVSGGPDTMAAPDFKPFGFHLIGTRLLQRTDKGPAMQLTYEAKVGTRVSLYFSPADGADKTRLTLREEGPISLLFWHDKGRSYSMIGEVDRDTLLSMGKVVNGKWTASPADDDSSSGSSAKGGNDGDQAGTGAEGAQGAPDGSQRNIDDGDSADPADNGGVNQEQDARDDNRGNKDSDAA